MHIAGLSYQKVRGILAERQITHKEFADMAGVSYAYVCRILCGLQVGELAQMKLERAVTRLLESERPRAS
jgi:predicted transcriptional regulator